MKQTPLGPGAKALARGTSFSAPPKPLARRTALKASAPAKGRRSSTLKPRKGFAVADAQRAKIQGQVCAVTECFVEECDPAHLIARGFAPDREGDPRAVVPLCRRHHDEYDNAKTLSLLEHLEPLHRSELAYAVETVGLITALELITNDRWAPLPKPEPLPAPIPGQQELV